MAQLHSQMSSQSGMSDTRFRDMYQGIEKDSLAYKMMSSMGWKEGEGLGANKQGISVHVRAHKKFDTAGVGLKESSARAQDWTLEMCKFSAILEGLQEVVNTAASPAANGDKGAQPKKSNKSKKRMKPDSDDSTETSETSNRDNSGSPSVVADKAAATKLSTHAARYAKRARNKLVKGYSVTDLAAILGQTAPTGMEFPVVAEISQPPRAGPTAERPIASAKGTQEKLATHVSTQAAQSHAMAASESDRSWWSSAFARHAAVGTSSGVWDQEKAFGKKRGFSEQDQTDLYNSAQDGKVQGKQGLGIGGRAGEVKKRAWKGKKMRFSSDEENVQDGETDGTEADAAIPSPDSQDPNSDMLPGGTIIVWANGVRPTWFSRRSSVRQGSMASIGGAEAGKVDVGNDGDAAATAHAERVKLTEKQRQKCLRVTSKMLRKRGGSVKLGDAVDKALRALQLHEQPDTQQLRKRVKSALRKADGWSIESGKLVLTACV